MREGKKTGSSGYSAIGLFAVSIIILISSCTTLPEDYSTSNAMGILPESSSVIMGLNPGKSPVFFENFISSTGQDEFAFILDFKDRLSKLYLSFSPGEDGSQSVSAVLLGDFPRSFVNLALSSEDSWMRIRNDEEFWTGTETPANIYIPVSDLICFTNDCPEQMIEQYQSGRMMNLPVELLDREEELDFFFFVPQDALESTGDGTMPSQFSGLQFNQIYGGISAEAENSEAFFVFETGDERSAKAFNGMLKAFLLLTFRGSEALDVRTLINTASIETVEKTVYADNLVFPTSATGEMFQLFQTFISPQ